jgi:hypothetical protein
MISPEATAVMIGSICYGVSTVVGIKLRDDLTVPTAAALAPAVAALSLSLDAGPTWYLLIGPAIASLGLLAARRKVLEIASHAALYGGCIFGIRVLGGGSEPTETIVVVVALSFVVLYSLGEVIRQKVSFRGHAHITADLRMWLLLDGVLVSACGLTILVVGRLGWAAFIAMAGVLALTKREFEGFAKSRLALDQTVRSLESLMSARQN